MTHTALWVGTYPAAGPGSSWGTGEGVWRLVLTADGATASLEAALAVATPTPSFLALAPDGRHLHAVAEHPDGTVTTFAVAGERLVEVARVPVAGDSPCHVLVHPGGHAMYVSCYASGTLAVLLLDDGVPTGPPVQVLGGSGAGPRADRQEGPHVHSSVLLDDVLLVADLGTDELRRHVVRPDGTLVPDGVAHRFPPGTGPRHVAVAGDVLHVVGELTATVHVLAWDAATRTAHEVQVVPSSATRGLAGEALPAHVERVGAHVLVGARGPDVLARFDVAPDGTLVHAQDVPVGGSWPRHHAVVGAPGDGWVVVAAQEGDVVTALPWTAGGLRPVAARAAVPRPTCVVVAR